MNRFYELLLVLSPELNDAQLRDELKKVEDLLRNSGGSGVQTERWGKRELGHTMKKFNHGTYVLIRFESSNFDLPLSLNTQLRIAEQVLRFQVHRINTKVRKFKGNPKRRENILTSSYDYDEPGDLDYADM